MANFMILSDLHEEFSPLELSGVPDELDAVLLAGDLGAPGNMPDVMRGIRDVTGVPVYAVEGNHDLWRRGRTFRTWRKIRESTDQRLQEMSVAAPEMRVLRAGASVTVAGTRVIGATLWTDGKLGDEPPVFLRDRLLDRMNDYRKMTIEDEKRGIWRKAKPEDLFREHKKDLAGILSALDTPFSGPTVVMTHHVPLAELVRPILTSDGKDLRAAYGSDLSEVLMQRKFDAWVYGHSHQPEDVHLATRFGDARFLSNPRGYPGELPNFKPNVVLSVADDPAASLDL